MILTGKIAIVTGGGQGIGQAICKILAEEGASVIVVDIDILNARQTVSELTHEGFKAEATKTDISNGTEIKHLVDLVRQKYNHIDILINNAGLGLFRSIEECTEEEWDQVMAVNLKGPFLLSKELLPIMKAQRKGTIINIVSVAGKTGGIASGGPYSVSKAGLECLTKSLARELAPYQVRVNGIAPGIIETQLTAHHKPSFIETIPLGSKGNPRDVAEAVLFLASSRSKHITGEILDVNGGLLMD